LLHISQKIIRKLPECGEGVGFFPTAIVAMIAFSLRVIVTDHPLAFNDMIHLDTHVILWLYLRKGEGLSGRARQLIEYEDVILISPMILLELD
jgi:hypothetical protein